MAKGKQANAIAQQFGDAEDIIRAAALVIGAAIELKDKVQPLLESEDGKAVAEKAKGAVGGIVGKIAGAKESFADTRRAKKEEKDIAKALKEAQQAVLENASYSVPIKEYQKLCGSNNAAAAVVSTGLMNTSGCFAIATYSKVDFDKDLTDYLGVYVGSGSCVGDAIDHACSRFGNADVYADIKYEQNVRLYVYPCQSTELGTKSKALFDILQAGSSYNAGEEAEEE